MHDPAATSIVVFGRGLAIDETGIRLSHASILRVHAAANYVDENVAVFRSRRGRIVFSGGWPGAAEGARRPPAEFREAALMLEHGRDLEVSGEVLSRYADLTAEIESDSTLENVLRIKENGYFAGISFTAVDPLGIVAHPGHIERIEYLVRKVFGLPDNAVLRIVAPGIDKLSGGLSEHVMMPLTRLFFFGARSHVALRRRQHILAVGRNLIFSHRSAPGADASAADASGADA